MVRMNDKVEEMARLMRDSSAVLTIFAIVLKREEDCYILVSFEDAVKSSM